MTCGKRPDSSMRTASMAVLHRQECALRHTKAATVRPINALQSYGKKASRQEQSKADAQTPVGAKNGARSGRFRRPPKARIARACSGSQRHILPAVRFVPFRSRHYPESSCRSIWARLAAPVAP